MNISDTGLFGVFEEPLEVWSLGDLRLHTGQSSRKVSVRISRVYDLKAGLVFRHETERDRRFIASMIEELVAERLRQGEKISPPF